MKVLKVFLLSISFVGTEPEDGILVFIQNNSAFHTARHCKRGFLSKIEDERSPWPVLSPDFNPIKTIRASLARSVYCNERQFKTVL